MSYTDDFRHLEIQLEDIKAATNNFRDKPIGVGGFGAVYKGELILPKGRRKTVAFKRLDRKFGQGDVEFWKEITMLSQLSHENLASLLRFCREGDERILVYEYASRRSLDRYLDKASLTWTQRLNICLGAARGIAYLHDPKKTQQRVIHRDIKSSNILLDDDWTAKVSDFGLSKIGPANQPRTYLVSNIAGTPGYCDPAYYETGILSKECDVYSFGVVLSEVMCGRLCCEFDKDRLICILVHTWKKRYDEDRLDDIIFPDIKQQIIPESLSRFAAIAKRCLKREHKERPTMDEVVEELEIALHHQQNPELDNANVTKSYGELVERFDVKIPLEDVQLATNNFSDDKLIGRFGFGWLYKGSLPEYDMVLFKRFDRRLWQGFSDLSKLVWLLYTCRHVNLVSFLRFCNEDDEMILVYEYESRGSLSRYLSDPALTWIRRLKICLEVVRATDYLDYSEIAKHRVLHRDIKSSNIVLSENWKAKVSDSSQSFVPANQLQAQPFFNAAGYSDPFYQEAGSLTMESSVYSFGVVLFEIMCGSLCTEYCYGELVLFLPKWRRCYEEKRLDQIIFSDLKKQMDASSLNTFSSIAYQCLNKAPQERPRIPEILNELRTALEQQKEFEERMSSKNLVISQMSNTPRSRSEFHVISRMSSCWSWPYGCSLF